MSDLPPPPPEFEPGPSYQPPPPPDPATQAPQTAKGWATLDTGQSVELAGPGARLGARILDWLIMAAVGLLIGLVGIGGTINDETGSEATELAIEDVLITLLLLVVIGIAYEVSMIALKGQTLGKMATKIKVIRADNGQLVGWGKSIVRWIVPVLLVMIPFNGWILALLAYIALTWDRVRQGWHDKAAKTLVVKA